MQSVARPVITLEHAVDRFFPKRGRRHIGSRDSSRASCSSISSSSRSGSSSRSSSRRGCTKPWKYY